MANYKCNKPYSTSWNGVHSKYELVPDKNNPLPPKNIFVTTPYIAGILDIRWDNPLEESANSQWSIIGVNIYRSNDSECGPFTKININPVETLYYRDQTSHQFVPNEDVLPTLKKGVNSAGDWLFTTKNKPLIKANTQNEAVTNPQDITVRIDNGDGKGLVVVPAKYVDGNKGDVYLITKEVFNPVTKKIEQARLPEGSNAKIYCSYWFNSSYIKSNLVARNFYKVTSVGRDKQGNILETDLGQVKAANVFELDKPHYIWKSIIAKNRYLLEQFGERVKLFIRKEVGEKCPHYSYTHEQATNYCPICFGSGYIGGYYGPFDITVASPEAEKHIELTDVGLKLNFTFESWMGPSPLIRTRDFVVRQNGERLMIGSVTPQGAKGAVFQQHFMLNYRDSKDIIYQVPLDGSAASPKYLPPSNNQVISVSDDTRGINQPVVNTSPEIPAHKSKRAETEKGRTIDFENVTW